jgi:hypothetical protein
MRDAWCSSIVSGVRLSAFGLRTVAANRHRDLGQVARRRAEEVHVAAEQGLKNCAGEIRP